jgi:hypothetical protein
MADQADVEVALVTLVAGALYPNGTAEASVPGPDCRIYRGWPNAAALDADLAAGRINVTVFPISEPTRITTRYTEAWLGTSPTPGLLVEVLDNAVVFSGTAGPGQVAGILADGRTYVYRNQAGDTPALVAANLAAQAQSDWVVHLVGSEITLCGAVHVVARVAADASVLKEIRRQEQGFRITCWCPTPASRDAAAVAIDQALARQTFIDMPDTSCARIAYNGTAVFDQSQDALLYRRDLLYRIEYPTIINDNQSVMLFGDLVTNAAQFFA